MAATATRRGSKAAAPVVEETEGDEEDEFEDLDEDETEADELEELEEDEEPAETPAPKAKKTTTTKKATTTTKKTVEVPKFGSAQLAAHVTEVTGETYDARGIRMLLRKLAADGKLNRVVGETRDRYSFSGPEDPTVVAVVGMIKDGTAKALKQAGLEKVKAAAAEKKAAAASKTKAAAAEDEDMEEIDEAPKPRTRRAAAKPAAPAKATPARRRASATA